MKSFKDIIKNGGVAVMKTDTLYGLVCDARNQPALDRIYYIKKRDRKKACIVLVGDYSQIELFGITIDADLKKVLDQYWPGKNSIILTTLNDGVNTHYIHRGTGGIAFRIPNDKDLQKILLDVGPLAAPSANPEGKPPAQNITEAIDYFGDKVDYYLDGGQVENAQPSKIIKISNLIDVEIIRE